MKPFFGKPGFDLLLPEERESLQKEQAGSSADSKKKESSAPAPKPKSSVPLRIAGKTTPKPAAPHPAENMFVEDLTSVPEPQTGNNKQPATEITHTQATNCARAAIERTSFERKNCFAPHKNRHR